MAAVTDAHFEEGLERAIHEMESLNEWTHPAHAKQVVRVLLGHFHSLDSSLEDDPLLYAYQLRDHLPKVASLVIKLQKWSDAVIESTPDQIFETGVQ